MNNSDSFPGASTPSTPSTPQTSTNSTTTIPSGHSSSKTNTISRATNRRHIQPYSSTGPYDSDMDLAVHGLHIVDSSHLHPGYKPRRRDAAPHYHHQESADKMSSSSSSSSSSSTPSPTRLPLFSNSSMNNASDSNSSPSEDMKVPRKWGVQFYPSLKQRVREEREQRDVRRFPGAKEGRTKDAHARLQVGSGRGYNNDDDGGDGDVEMVDMDVPADGGDNWKVAREFERGYDGDIEMGDAPPLSSHEVKGAKGARCSGRNGSNGGFHGGRGRSELPLKHVQTETEGGDTNESISKKRARGSDQMDEEEEKVEHKRMRSSV